MSEPTRERVRIDVPGNPGSAYEFDGLVYPPVRIPEGPNEGLHQLRIRPVSSIECCATTLRSSQSTRVRTDRHDAPVLSIGVLDPGYRSEWGDVSRGVGDWFLEVELPVPAGHFGHQARQSRHGPPS